MLLFLPGLKPVDPELDKRAFEQNIAPPSAVSPLEEAGVTWVMVKTRRDAILLHTGSLGKAFAAWRTCVTDLYKSWGVDPAVIKIPHARWAALPTGSARTTIQARRWPNTRAGWSIFGSVSIWSVGRANVRCSAR